jgi:hypothetical protein
MQHMRNKLVLSENGEWIRQPGGAAIFAPWAKRRSPAASAASLELGAETFSERPVDLPTPLLPDPSETGG